MICCCRYCTTITDYHWQAPSQSQYSTLPSRPISAQHWGWSASNVMRRTNGRPCQGVRGEDSADATEVSSEASDSALIWLFGKYRHYSHWLISDILTAPDIILTFYLHQLASLGCQRTSVINWLSQPSFYWFVSPGQTRSGSQRYWSGLACNFLMCRIWDELWYEDSLWYKLKTRTVYFNFVFTNIRYIKIKYDY